MVRAALCSVLEVSSIFVITFCTIHPQHCNEVDKMQNMLTLRTEVSRVSKFEIVLPAIRMQIKKFPTV